jgi:hypothetical protein
MRRADLATIDAKQGSFDVERAVRTGAPPFGVSLRQPCRSPSLGWLGGTRQ